MHLWVVLVGLLRLSLSCCDSIVGVGHRDVALQNVKRVSARGHFILRLGGSTKTY